jgi:hypothetical protein
MVNSQEMIVFYLFGLVLGLVQRHACADNLLGVLVPNDPASFVLF